MRRVRCYGSFNISLDYRIGFIDYWFGGWRAKLLNEEFGKVKFIYSKKGVEIPTSDVPKRIYQSVEYGHSPN